MILNKLNGYKELKTKKQNKVNINNDENILYHYDVNPQKIIIFKKRSMV